MLTFAGLVGSLLVFLLLVFLLLVLLLQFKGGTRLRLHKGGCTNLHELVMSMLYAPHLFMLVRFLGFVVLLMHWAHVLDLDTQQTHFPSATKKRKMK